MPYRFIDHTGDTAVELTAASEPELFREAVRALCAIFVETDGAAAPVARQERPIDLEAEDAESLLIDLLNELIFLFDAEGFLSAELEIDSLSAGSPARLRGAIRGEPFDPERHVFFTEVKAATFHDVKIQRVGDELRLIVVFDL